MLLNDQVHVARRFTRSVRIDTDLGQEEGLEGFICPQSSAEVLLSMARHIVQTGQGAFTWTGPYGSGKSSLAIGLGALLNGNADLREKATAIFGAQLTQTLWQMMPTGAKGWRILPVVGRRGSTLDIIGDAIQKTGIAPHLPNDGWDERNLVKALIDIAHSDPDSHGGLILFIDEMGKLLEAASQDGNDIFVLQELAEAASRSQGRLVIIGVLHQAFAEYAHRLSYELRDEWAKIQGRFIDLVVDTAGEEQIDLISQAIEKDREVNKAGKTAMAIAEVVSRGKAIETTQLAIKLEKCWPLHPIVVTLLGPISRRRFGQNQRSLFGFLNSSEPHGFQDFLNQAEETALYTPDRLWDYLRINLEPSILASPDGHRWALAAEAVERCELAGAGEQHLRLLKTIAVIDLFRGRSGLVANFTVLHTCVADMPVDKLKGILADLNKWSFTIFKKFQDAHAIYAGSDFDIEQALRTALDEIGEIDFKRLNEFAGFQPVLAKRHYHETGAMRWLDIQVTPVSSIIKYAEHYQPKHGAIGQFLLAVPTEEESEAQIHGLCRKAADLSNSTNRPWDIMVGASKQSRAIIPLIRELLALEGMSNHHPALAGDSIARREVSARLMELEMLLENALRTAFDKAEWFSRHSPKIDFSPISLSSTASELAERRFPQCPRIQNELLNRNKPSSSAIAAQNNLLRNMVLNEGTPRLGIEGFPAEGGLYVSLLEATGLYKEVNGKWRFVFPPPDSNDPMCLKPMWEAARAYIIDNADRTIPISAIYAIWRNPPYGVKDGLMPIIMTAFILAQRNKLAIYRDKTFRAKFDDVDAEWLAKEPESIGIRWMELGNISHKLLSNLTEMLRDIKPENTPANLEPIEIARCLVATYDQLPAWTKRTMHLSQNALHLRTLLKQAKDPNKVIFDDLPGLLGKDHADDDDEADLNQLMSNIRVGLEELIQAYPTMLDRLRDLMLSELQVPNLSQQSITELRERAANIRQLSGDFRLESFVARLAQFDGSDESFEAIASLAANKPAHDWVDLNFDQASMEIADMAQKFIRAETYARVKNRADKRQAMAVMVGINGRPSPLLQEFAVTDADRPEIDRLVEYMQTALQQTQPEQSHLILAALAELSAEYMQRPVSKNSDIATEKS